MLLKQGDARDEIVDRRLAATLAGVAGALNAAAFYAVGFFSANMTGNVSLLSDFLALRSMGKAAFYLSIVLIFIGGSMASTLVINAGRRRAFAGVYALNILIEAGLLMIIGCADIWLPQPQQLQVVVLGLAFCMGLQNAVVTRISDARVRTTHISGMATDIGIELGQLIDIKRNREPAAEAVPVMSRLRLHVETIASFLLGGIVGVWLYRMIEGGLFWLSAGVLLLIGAVALLKAARLSESSNVR